MRCAWRRTFLASESPESARYVVNTCKHVLIQPKARVSAVRRNLKEAGCGEHTNPRANLWPDEQKSHQVANEDKTAFQAEVQ